MLDEFLKLDELHNYVLVVVFSSYDKRNTELKATFSLPDGYVHVYFPVKNLEYRERYTIKIREDLSTITILNPLEGDWIPYKLAKPIRREVE